MQSNGTSLQSLTDRIRAKTEQDTQEIENLTRQQFESLSRNLAESSKKALNTTESVIRSSIAELEKDITSRFESLGNIFSRKYRYFIFLSIGILVLTLSICWGLITLSSRQVEDLRREVAELSVRKVRMEHTIAAWPMTVHNDTNGRFIVPTPTHTLSEATFKGQAAWKLE